MRIMGIDPGVAIVGYGVLDKKISQLIPVDYGSIQTNARFSTEHRLKLIYDDCIFLFNKYKPDVVGIEKLFFNRNVTTALAVGQARGVIMLAAFETGVEITEYTPLQVKMAVVGYGRAEKKQVQELVKMLLGLPEIPKPDDVADALAIAICEAHSNRSHLRKVRNERD